METYDSSTQRASLLKFAKALGSRDAALRRDECGDPAIHGKTGHIYAVPGGYQLCVMGWAGLGWGNAKRAMNFAKATQDGDTEGCLFMARLPTKAEAEVIRHYIGVAKRVEFSPEHVATLQARARGWAKNPPSSTGGYHGGQIAA